jgi:hypothetical protein
MALLEINFLTDFCADCKDWDLTKKTLAKAILTASNNPFSLQCVLLSDVHGLAMVAIKRPGVRLIRHVSLMSAS